MGAQKVAWSLEDQNGFRRPEGLSEEDKKVLRKPEGILEDQEFFWESRRYVEDQKAFRRPEGL